MIASLADLARTLGGALMFVKNPEYFLTIAKERSISKAAEQMYLSQPYLSQYLAKLEHTLGVALMDRSHTPLTLTSAGEVFYAYLERQSYLDRQLLSDLRDIQDRNRPVLHIGVSPWRGAMLLPDILPRFREEFPVVDFSLYEGNSNQLEDELSHGRVDLVICFQPIMLDGVETVPLTQQRLVMVVPRSFTDQLFGDQAEVIREQFSNGADIGAFQSMPFVLIKRGNRTRSIVDQYFSRYYFKPKLILETENTVTTLAMAQAGVGITICPELFLRAIPAASASSAGVDFFPLTDPSTFSRLIAGYRLDRPLSHFGERFIAIAQQATADD